MTYHISEQPTKITPSYPVTSSETTRKNGLRATDI